MIKNSDTKKADNLDEEQYEREDIYISPQFMNDAFRKGIRSQGEKYLTMLHERLSNDSDFIPYLKNEDVQNFHNAFNMLKKKFEPTNNRSPSYRNNVIVSIDSFTELGLRKFIVDKIGQLAFQLENISPSSTQRINSETFEDSFESEIEEEEEYEYEEDDFENVNNEISPTFSSLDNYVGVGNVNSKKPFFSYDFGHSPSKGKTVEMKVSPSKPNTLIRKKIRNDGFRQSNTFIPHNDTDSSHVSKMNKVFQPRSPTSHQAILSPSKLEMVENAAQKRRPYSMQAVQLSGVEEKTSSSRALTAAADNNDVKKRNKIQKAWITKKQWKLGEIIGSGSFGDVFKVLNDTGRIFAAKRMRIANTVAAEELLSEIQLMRGLSHDNIVEYMGAWVDEQECVIYIFQQWVPGGSVHQILQKFGPLELGVVKNYMRQILSGLQYLHNSGIVHRDIKGGNILVDEFGVVKLADFGASTKLSQLDKTMEGIGLKGTPYFMAPEVLSQNGKYGRKGDIWAVGCTMVQMLTGEPPWKDKDIKCHVQLFLLLNKWEGPPEIKCKISEDARECLELCFQKEEKLRPYANVLLQCKFLKDDDLDDSNPSVMDPNLSSSSGLDDSGVMKGLKQAMNNAVNLSKLITPRRNEDIQPIARTPSPSKNPHSFININFHKLPPANFASPVAAASSVDVEATPRLMKSNIAAYNYESPDRNLQFQDRNIYNNIAMVDSDGNDVGKAPRDIILLKSNFPVSNTLESANAQAQIPAKKNPFARGVVSLKSNSTESNISSEQTSPGILVMESRSPSKAELSNYNHSTTEHNNDLPSQSNSSPQGFHSSPIAGYATHYPHNAPTTFQPKATSSQNGTSNVNNSASAILLKYPTVVPLVGIEEADEESTPHDKIAQSGEEVEKEGQKPTNTDGKKSRTSSIGLLEPSFTSNSHLYNGNTTNKRILRAKSSESSLDPNMGNVKSVSTTAGISKVSASSGGKAGKVGSNTTLHRSSSSGTGVSVVGRVSPQASRSQLQPVTVSSSVDAAGLSQRQGVAASSRAQLQQHGQSSAATIPKAINGSRVHQLRAMKVNAMKLNSADEES